jgi:hypothetical protein
VRSLIIDRALGVVAVTLADGRTVTEAAERMPFDPTSRLIRLEFVPRDRRLTATTVHGDTVEIDLPATPEDATSAATPVIYLDQNHWSAVANSIYDRARLRPVERDAADQIAAWARDKRLTLPASSSHFHETTKWRDDARRYALGLTLAQFSRGWLMRDPLQVRRDEIRSVLPGAAGGPIRPVITLLPQTLHEAANRRIAPGYIPSPDLPPSAAFVTSALVAASAHIDTILDADYVEPGPDTGWARAQQHFSQTLHSTGASVDRKRKAIDTWLVTDLRHDIAEEASAAGVDPGLFERWLTTAARILGGTPSVGLYREMVHERHLNPTTTWRLNDVTDMVYLSCAAAYTDVVVCERHMGHILRIAVRRRQASTVICTSLAEAVDAVGAITG